MRSGMILAALTCFVLGVMPTFFIDWMDIIPETACRDKDQRVLRAYGWLWLAPVARERASYSGTIVFLGISLSWSLFTLFFTSSRDHSQGADMGLRFRQAQPEDASTMPRPFQCRYAGYSLSL